MPDATEIRGVLKERRNVMSNWFGTTVPDEQYARNGDTTTVRKLRYDHDVIYFYDTDVRGECYRYARSFIQWNCDTFFMFFRGTPSYSPTTSSFPYDLYASVQMNLLTSCTSLKCLHQRYIPRWCQWGKHTRVYLSKYVTHIVWTQCWVEHFRPCRRGILLFSLE